VRADLSTPQWRFLVLEQAVGGAVFNLLLNAALAWTTYRSLPGVPHWGSPAVAGDLVLTSFLLPFLTGLVVTGTTRTRLRRGTLLPLERPRTAPRLARLPRASWKRAVLAGALVALAAAPPLLLGLAALGETYLRLADFVAFKALYTGALAALAAPLFAWWALADSPLPRAQGEPPSP